MSEQEKAGGKGVQRQAPIVLLWIDGTHATYTQCHKGGSHTVSLWIEGTNITYKEKTWEGFTSCCFTLMGRLQLTQGVRRDCLAPRRSFGIDATDVIHMGHPWGGGGGRTSCCFGPMAVPYTKSRDGKCHTETMWIHGTAASYSRCRGEYFTHFF